MDNPTIYEYTSLADLTEALIALQGIKSHNEFAKSTCRKLEDEIARKEADIRDRANWVDPCPGATMDERMAVYMKLFAEDLCRALYHPMTPPKK